MRTVFRFKPLAATSRREPSCQRFRRTDRSAVARFMSMPSTRTQPTGSESYQALAHCDKAIGGIEFVRVRVDWTEAANANSEQILTAFQDVERILKDEPSLRHPLSILNILASFPGDESVPERIASHSWSCCQRRRRRPIWTP